MAGQCWLKSYLSTCVHVVEDYVWPRALCNTYHFSGIFHINPRCNSLSSRIDPRLITDHPRFVPVRCLPPNSNQDMSLSFSKAFCVNVQPPYSLFGPSTLVDRVTDGIFLDRVPEVISTRGVSSSNLRHPLIYKLPPKYYKNQLGVPIPFDSDLYIHSSIVPIFRATFRIVALSSCSVRPSQASPYMAPV